MPLFLELWLYKFLYNFPISKSFFITFLTLSNSSFNGPIPSQTYRWWCCIPGFGHSHGMGRIQHDNQGTIETGNDEGFKQYYPLMWELEKKPAYVELWYSIFIENTKKDKPFLIPFNLSPLFSISNENERILLFLTILTLIYFEKFYNREVFSIGRNYIMSRTLSFVKFMTLIQQFESPRIGIDPTVKLGGQLMWTVLNTWWIISKIQWFSPTIKPTQTMSSMEYWLLLFSFLASCSKSTTKACLFSTFQFSWAEYSDVCILFLIKPAQKLNAQYINSIRRLKHIPEVINQSIGY